MSRAQLSSLLGVHKSMVSRWLSGEMKPTGYNLARISTALAKAKPGFNMTLWTAPRAEFEAALGLPSASASAAGLAPQDGSLVSPARPLFDVRLVYMVAAAAVLLIFVLGAWLWWRSASAGVPALHAVTVPSRESVAVLPFVNMSGDPAKEYLGDGMAEELLNDLANTSDLHVAARTSSFAFKGKHSDIRDIAEKLNVRTVLEGSVRQEGKRVRIVAQLIDAQSGFHIWSARYDRSINDVLAVQDEIARSIARVLGQKLVRRTGRTIDPAAYQDYLQAQFFFRQRSVIGSQRADELLKKVIQRQPDFAAAYALRGHLLMLRSGGENPAMLAEAQNMTAKALQLEPGNQDALDTKLELSLQAWDWPAVYRTGHQLLAQPKRSANSYNGIGFFYQYMGFPKVALEARRRAVQLDPLSFSYRNNLGAAQWHVGQRSEAIATLGRAFELQPNHLAILRELCAFNATAGRLNEARRYPPLIAALNNSHFRWVGGECQIEIALAEHKLAEARRLLDHGDWKSFDLAELGALYARAGDMHHAMKLFSKAYDRHQPWLIWIRYDTVTPRAVLADARWRALWHRPLLAQWQRYHDRIAAELAQPHDDSFSKPTQ